MSIPIPKNARVVLKQFWIVVMPDGTAQADGCSYHLTERDRDQMVKEVADRLGTDLSEPREEPIGDPVPVYATPEFCQQIQSGHSGLRVK